MWSYITFLHRILYLFNILFCGASFHAYITHLLSEHTGRLCMIASSMVSSHLAPNTRSWPFFLLPCNEGDSTLERQPRFMHNNDLPTQWCITLRARKKQRTLSKQNLFTLAKSEICWIRTLASWLGKPLSRLFPGKGFEFFLCLWKFAYRMYCTSGSGPLKEILQFHLYSRMSHLLCLIANAVIQMTRCRHSLGFPENTDCFL